jgi:predicted TIM-barrel fold metal-dependent hydrolase
VIDMSGVLPTAERLAQEIRSLLADPGYRRRFGARWTRVMGVTDDQVDEVLGLAEDRWRGGAARVLSGAARTPAGAAAEYALLGVEHTVLHVPPPRPGSLTNDELARVVGEGGGHFVGFARFDPERPARSLAGVRRCVVEHGFRGISVTPYWHRLAASEAAYEPLWELAQELDVVVYVHCSTHPVRTVPLELSHPRHLDVVAGRHLELRLLVGHAGWPWIADVVAMALRHPTVTLEFATFRPRELSTPGSGWELLWRQLSRSLQDQVAWASTWQLLGLPLAEVVAEVAGLGLTPEMHHKFTHANAARLLRLDAA